MLVCAALLILGCLAKVATCGCGSQWRQVETLQCLSDSLALRTVRSDSTLDCVLVAQRSTGLLVVDFNSHTRQCSLFKYIAVCHLIGGVASNEISALHSCAAFVNARAADFMTLSRKLSSSAAGSSLRAAWVMSDDEEASKSNLVCGETQQWQSESVEFSSEGAKFDGVSSKMWLENVQFANLQRGLTWLVRLKRSMIRESTLLESIQCDHRTRGTVFWDGWPSGWGLYFYRYDQNQIVEFLSDRSTNSYDASTFVEVGVASPSPNSRSFYSNAGFVSQSQVAQRRTYPKAVNLDFFCFTFGFVYGDPRMLNGTVRSVAIMNSSMSAAEISSFFALVRLKPNRKTFLSGAERRQS